MHELFEADSQPLYDRAMAALDAVSQNAAHDIGECTDLALLGEMYRAALHCEQMLIEIRIRAEKRTGRRYREMLRNGTLGGER
jgi:hypothetical protein